MLIYSQWQPDGGYDYYAADEVAPIGQDLPVPHLSAVGALGVPSVEAGRPIPPGARYAGNGDLPRGVISPMLRDGFNRMAGYDLSRVPPYVWFFAGAAVMGAAWWLWRKK